MSQAPTTFMQVMIVILLVLPGVSYQFVRERLRGLAPGHKELGERVLRALTAGIVLDTVYVVLGGEWLVRLFYDRQQGWLADAATNPRLAALAALLLLVVIPAGSAWLVGWLAVRGTGSAYKPTPTAWDDAFSKRAHCFVRARLKSGHWVGGWYGERSFASGYPQSADVYLQTAWALSKAGRFEHSLPYSGGVYIRMDEVECLDFIEAPREEGGSTDE
ncbi:DUF6338 family protein [Nonomuraea turcica]|uniref:DUF6338 family protein n=1 Tax=Nonomuraea sp. G32 TaxID=3067274 RepID=UPI00273A8409|nr:DUF6338 family protein [Nonomuraea sp. G32]MDP4512028.1 DUF6338 family protein [Nonomuraea sp. G32]